MSHDLQHSLDHNRRLLLKGGPGGQPGAATYGGGADSLLRPEKISDAALGTHESIQTAALKLADRKRCADVSPRGGFHWPSAVLTMPTSCQGPANCRLC